MKLSAGCQLGKQGSAHGWHTVCPHPPRHKPNHSLGGHLVCQLPQPAGLPCHRPCAGCWHQLGAPGYHARARSAQPRSLFWAPHNNLLHPPSAPAWRSHRMRRRVMLPVLLALLCSCAMGMDVALAPDQAPPPAATAPHDVSAAGAPRPAAPAPGVPPVAPGVSPRAAAVCSRCQ